MGVGVAVARESVEGIVERVVFVNRTGFTVVRLGLEDGESISAKGTVLLGVQPGETLRLVGQRGHNPTYGDEFAAEGCEYVEPATRHAIRRYLASGLVKGIGPRLAEAIVDEFKEDTLHVIDTTPERLLEVHLIGPTRCAEILASWQQHQEIRQLMVLLQSAEVSPTHAPRIAHYFRVERGEAKEVTDVLEIVQENPYRLTEVYRMGFKLADRVALWLGLPERSPQRLQAALLHTLDSAGLDGHCFLFERQLVKQTMSKALGDQELEELLPEQLDVLRASQRVVVQLMPYQDTHYPAVFSPRLHAAETSVAARLARLNKPDSRLSRMSRSDRWDSAPLPLTDSAVELAPAQEQAVRMALGRPVSVLTGGPGCGKSFTVKAIVDVVEAAGGRVSLAAPTGRAAKRLSELTDRTATTIHRLIRKPREDDDSPVTLFDHQDPLDADLIVIDEASMLDLPLFDRLLEKIRPGTHLLLVGDIHQLPSVGPGKVLHDLLQVRAIPRVALTEIFRQGRDSAITMNAHRINAGQAVVNGRDFWFIPVARPQAIAEQVVDIVTRRLPAGCNARPGDIQVLAPTRTGPTGTHELAMALQAVINPPTDGGDQHWGDGRPFRTGDRVIAVRNDPRKGPRGVLNGSTATVTALDDKERELRIRLDDGDTAVYGYDELDVLLHAYAITVHRAQGSEYPYVVVPLTTTGSAYKLLRRNLLYTAVTRAKQMLVLVGEPAALELAVKRPEPPRNTALAARLHDAIEGTSLLPRPLRSTDGQTSLLN